MLMSIRFMDVVAMFMLCSFTVFSQNKKQFHDEFGIKGEVLYSGKWNDTLLPEKGLYQIKWRDYASGELKSYNINGRLKNYLPEGKWLWNEATWEYTIQLGNNLFPNFNATGVRNSWEGNFSKGAANGNWNFYSDSVTQNLNILKRKIAIQCSYSNGLPAGKITVNNYTDDIKYFASGSVSNNGIAQGVWMFQYLTLPEKVTVREERIYDSGVLVEVRVATKDTVIVNSFDLVKQQLQAIKNNTSHLNFRIGEHDFFDDGVATESQKWLSIYINDYFLKGFKHEAFTYKVERKPIVYRKIEYPISANEQRYITAADSLIQQQLNAIINRLNYRNILINRGWSQELDIAIAYAEAAKQKLLIADSLLQRTKLPLFTYKNRFLQGAVSWNIPLNNQLEVFGSYYDTASISLPFFLTDADTLYIFKALNDYVQSVAATNNKQLEIIDKVYLLLQKEEELHQLEDSMSLKLKQLEQLYSGDSKLMIAIYEKWVNAFLKLRFQEYAKTNDYEAAKDLSKRLLQKMDWLLQRDSIWHQFDLLPMQLKNAYTQYLYNPYNGKHDIEYLPKKRFYAKIVSDYYPWMYNKFTEASTWEELINHTEISTLFAADLLDFATVNTNASKKLEARLKKEKSIDKAAKILHQFFRSK